MRTLLVVMVLAAIPAAAAAAPDAPDDAAAASPVGVDVTELTVTGAGGVQTMVIHDALSIVDDATRRCYEHAQAQAPKLAGKIAIRFRLDARGAATNVAVTGVPSVGACLIAAIKEASFAGPAKGPIEIREKVSLRVLERQAGVLGTMQSGAFASLTGTGDLSSGFDDPAVYGGLLGDGTGEFEGGVGYGWGSAPGTGGFRGRVPSISIGQPSVQGDLNKAIVRRYIKRNAQKLQYCYEKQLRVTPRLAGTVATRFTIGADGKVSDATARGMASAEVNACVAAVIQDIEFPKPKGGEVVVSYPLVFRSSDDKRP
jgi:hypothetical protein